MNIACAPSDSGFPGTGQRGNMDDDDGWRRWRRWRCFLRRRRRNDDDDDDDLLFFLPERWQVLWIIDIKMIKLPFVKDVSFWTMDDQYLPCPLVKMPFFLAQQPAWIPTPPWTQEILYDTTLSRLNTLEKYIYIYICIYIYTYIHIYIYVNIPILYVYIYIHPPVIKHGNWKSTNSTWSLLWIGK